MIENARWSAQRDFDFSVRRLQELSNIPEPTLPLEQQALERAITEAQKDVLRFGAERVRTQEESYFWTHPGRLVGVGRISGHP